MPMNLAAYLNDISFVVYVEGDCVQCVIEGTRLTTYGKFLEILPKNRRKQKCTDCLAREPELEIILSVKFCIWPCNQLRMRDSKFVMCSALFYDTLRHNEYLHLPLR